MEEKRPIKKEWREVTCIIPDDDSDDDGSINGIGGWIGPQKWTLSKEEAIAEMENTIFWITDPMTKQMTSIKKATRNGRPHLTTAPDDSQNNNLENLPSCDSC